MQLSCIPVTYFRELMDGRRTLEWWVDFASDLGLNGLDFAQAWIQNLPLRAMEDLRRRIEDKGLGVCMVTCSPDFTHPDRGRREGTVEEMRRMIEIAHRLGARLIRVTAGQAHPAVLHEEGVAWVCEGLTRLLPEGMQAGIILAYENHTKASVWQYRDFSENSKVFLDIVRAMEGTALRVNFDTGNPLVQGEDPLPLLRQVCEKVASVHANDTLTRGRFDFCVVGQGLVPFAEVFQFLKHVAGFDGWISIEEFSGTGERGFREAVSFVRKAWQAA